MELTHIFTPLHKQTARDYIGRMNDNKVQCMTIAREFDEAFWDGERRYGYGGYRYDGRWKGVAQALIAQYNLQANAKILDVGCGKAFLLYELKVLLPEAEIVGMDISGYAIRHAKPEVHDQLIHHAAETPYGFSDNYFDLVISLTTLHNLKIAPLVDALKEIQRVGKQQYFVVESYRNPQELFNLQCWALTCESFFSPDEWQWVMRAAGYAGDVEFIYFE